MKHIVTILIFILSPIWVPIGILSLLLYCGIVYIPELYKAMYEIVEEFAEVLYGD